MQDKYLHESIMAAFDIRILFTNLELHCEGISN